MTGMLFRPVTRYAVPGYDAPTSRAWMAEGRCVEAVREGELPASVPNPWTDDAVPEVDKLWAKKQCAKCPVLEQCLAHAISVPAETGIWGGTTEKERESIRRKARRRGDLVRERQETTA